MNSKTLSALSLWNFAALLCGTALVFVLPWFVPPIKRVYSDSYNLGFNNSVAILGVALTLFALIGLRLRLRPIVPDNSRENYEKQTFWNLSISRLTRYDFVAAILVAGAAAIFAFAWHSIVPSHNYGEMKAFLPCSELILLGRKPYTQFQFPYGPLFLYFPVWIVRLSGNTVGADIGYICSLAVFTVTGLFLLAYATTIVEARRRLVIFALLSLPFVLNFDLGMQYTAMRFAAPYAALLWLHRSSFLAQQSGRPEAMWRTGLSFSIGVVFCFAISPDSGLGFLIAAIVYIGALLRKQDREKQTRFLWCLIIGIVVAATFLWTLSRDYLQGIWTFGSGGYNFPVVPSPPVLFYLSNLVFAVPILAVFGLRHYGTKGALALGWAALCFITIAPALGRCDPGHTFVNGLGVYVGSFALLSSLGTRRLYAYAAVLAVLFTFGLPSLAFKISGVDMKHALQAYQRGERKGDRMFWKAPLPADEATTDLLDAALKPYSKIGTPLGSSERLEIYLKRRGKFVPEYYTAPAYGAFTEEEVAAKNEDIRAIPVIIVPIQRASMTYDAVETHAYAREQGRYMSRLLLFPINYKRRNKPLSPDAEWGTFIRRHFKVVTELGPYYLMIRNDLVKRPR